ncbi:SxtJ family membrane protein [Mucilaginibacter sp. SMC90]|uniref:SxtJ family membrane protein n=1 Tax=Mucilaginibacter sp. SMC90 TaxID=2929803 RepID=UPI001FB2279D|nr:SxtJ family membrane protein [Mucilaginibacter sp. SMC90]UOE46541.1 SxtJ family membrane protein [Mucilaginibacter sp. SMC90]
MATQQKQLSNRAFCFQMAGISLFLGLLQYFTGKHFYLELLILFLIFSLIAIIRPSVVNRFQQAWMAAGDFMGKISTFLLLGIIYFAVITPFALFLRVIKLNKSVGKFNTEASTYWENPQQTSSSMTNQF